MEHIFKLGYIEHEQICHVCGGIIPKGKAIIGIKDKSTYSFVSHTNCMNC